ANLIDIGRVRSLLAAEHVRLLVLEATPITRRAELPVERSRRGVRKMRRGVEGGDEERLVARAVDRRQRFARHELGIGRVVKLVEARYETPAKTRRRKRQERWLRRQHAHADHLAKVEGRSVDVLEAEIDAAKDVGR